MNLKIFFLTLFITLTLVISIPLKKRENLENQNFSNTTTLVIENDIISTTLQSTTIPEVDTFLLDNVTFPTLSSTSPTQSTSVSTDSGIISSQSIISKENINVVGLSPIMHNVNDNNPNQNLSQYFLNTSNGIFNVNESIFSSSSCYYEGTSIFENGIKREMTEDEMNLMADFITKSVEFNLYWKYDEDSHDWVKINETVTSEKDSWPEIPCFCKYCSTKNE
ncbi:Hypothetical protein SRAE_2000444400 [Strongyloides ratti]|uniref:Uncharacterized protein n=1 Tax=Strongyloides ratti TaxID=34506 RepID=A0A090LJB4_STRRB|nr:Hypothetical protein SRAE_2000444400 [Strongyloides ratti]CEF69798.1 Hypothetical protein SRAE_2000444400 [Strongyloides ratti]